MHGWPVALGVPDHEELLESEPNNEPARANRSPHSRRHDGRVSDQRRRRLSVFAERQALVIKPIPRALFALRSFMTVKDAKDAEVIKTTHDTARFPSRLRADGDYTLIVEHLFNWNGPSETYRITVTPQDSDFGLPWPRIASTVPRGGSAVVLALTAVRRDYNGPIDVSLQGISGVSGQSTIPAGQVAVPLSSTPASPHHWVHRCAARTGNRQRCLSSGRQASGRL